jgi:hypothetical protein
VYAARTLALALAANGQTDQARLVAEAAVRDAYATQQSSERAATTEILTAIRG